MKTYLTLLLLVVAIGASAQNFTKVTSVADGTQIFKPVGGVEISPITTNMSLDSIRTYTYNFTISRDSTQNVVVQVLGFNKNSAQVYQTVLTMPGGIYHKWKALLTPMDAWIASQLKRINQLTN